MKFPWRLLRNRTGSCRGQKGQVERMIEIMDQNNRTVVHVSFSGGIYEPKMGEYRKLGSHEAGLIASALNFNTSIESLDLSDNRIGDEGAVLIGAALLNNSTLQKVSFSTNGIGQRGASAIASALMINTTLTDLDLGGNLIGDDGAECIATVLAKEVSICKLCLNSAGIGADGITSIASAIASNNTLLELSLRNNHMDLITSRALAESVKKNFVLLVLDLSYNKVCPEAAAAIADQLAKNGNPYCGRFRSRDIDVQLDRRALGSALGPTDSVKLAMLHCVGKSMSDEEYWQELARVIDQDALPKSSALQTKTQSLFVKDIQQQAPPFSRAA